MVKIPKGRLSFALSSSFSNAGNVVEEFTNIMHPKIRLKKNRPLEEISPPEVCVTPSMRFVI